METVAGEALLPGPGYSADAQSLPHQARTPSQSQTQTQLQSPFQAHGSSGQGRDLGPATEAEIGDCVEAFLREHDPGEEEGGSRGWGAQTQSQGQGPHAQGVLERLIAAGAFDSSRPGPQNAFARYSASLIDALPKRGGGSAGAVDEQLLRKSGLHAQYLRFLRISHCWGRLLQLQPQAAQVVLEHAEQLAALVYLRTAQNNAAQQAPTPPRAAAGSDPPLSSPFSPAGRSPGPGASGSAAPGTACARRVLWELIKSAGHTLQAPPAGAATPRAPPSPSPFSPGFTTPAPCGAAASASLYAPTPTPGRGAPYTPGYTGGALGPPAAGDPAVLFFSRASAAVQALFAAAQRCTLGLLVRSVPAEEGAEGGVGSALGGGGGAGPGNAVAASGAPTLALGAGERLAAALEVCQTLLGCLDAAAEEREEKAAWYPEYASAAAAGGAEPGAESGGGSGSGAPLAPWWTGASVRAGLAALTAVLDNLKREVSSSAVGALLSACFPAQERVAGVLLDAFARALEAQRAAALLGVPEAHQGLAGEYERTRRMLIDRLMGEALDGAGSEEEALQRLSWPVALAKRHAAYSSLFDLCWLRLHNRSMLLGLMMELSETHHRERFTRYVFSRLLQSEQLQALVHLGPQFPRELRAFLTDVPSLQWLHQIAIGDASGASATLLNLSLSSPPTDSLASVDASAGPGTAAGAAGASEVGGEDGPSEQADARASAAVTAALVKRVVGDAAHSPGAAPAPRGPPVASPDSSSRTLVARRRMLQLSKIAALAARDKEAAAEASTDLRLLAIQESVVGKGEPMLVGPYALPPLELIRSLVDLSDTPTPSLEAVQSSLSGAQGAAELEVGGVLKGPKALQKAFDALAVAGPDRLLRSSPEDATAVHEELTGVLARVWQRAAAADDWMELGQQMREQGWSSDQYTSAVQRTLLFYGASKLYKPKKPSSGLSDLPAASRTFEGVFPIFGGMSPSSQGDNRIAESVEQVLQANPAFAAAGDMMLESMQLACESNLMACH